MTADTTFEQAFRIVVGEEGGFTDNPADPGNWTGGRCGVGRCAGTKFGVSAGAYPGIEIVSLTLDSARAIYRKDYWDKIQGDNLPPSLALLTFDAAVNNGVGRAVRWLQQAVGVTADGVLGVVTLSAVKAREEHGMALLAEYQAQRLIFMTGLPLWRTFGGGWARRLCRLPFEAIHMGAGS